MDCKIILKKPTILAILVVLAIILLLIVVFFCRRPVVLVTDRAFNVLYGEKRSQYKQFSLSLCLFRRIKTVAIDEKASPDLVAQGALSLSLRPFAVFFPYRYKEAAMRYLKARSGFPVVILAGRKAQENNYESENNSQDSTMIPAASSGLLLWINTDSETDLYRAGTLAGIFTRHNKQNQEIALFHEDLNSEEIASFVTGLEGHQWDDFPIYSPELSEKDLSCAVILENFSFNEEKKADSLIFFTWMDPVLAPWKTLAIFDDSPWTQIGPALDILKGRRQSTFVPSEIITFRGDKTQKYIYNEINRSKILKKKVENADN